MLAAQSPKLLVPNAVLRLLAAGVRLLTVAVAETRIHAERNIASRRLGAELFDHVERAAVDMNVVLDDQFERFGVKNIGRVDDRRRLAASTKAGRHGPANLASAHRVDHAAPASYQVENRQARAGLLRVSYHVERSQVVDSLADLGGIVDVDRRAELAGEVACGDAGNPRP